MTPQSQKILDEFQVRKSRKQKAAFRAWLCGELERAGYKPAVEESFAGKNVVAGDPDHADILFSAHYDTCAVLPVPNFITPHNMLFYFIYQMLFCLFFLLVIVLCDIFAFAVLNLPFAAGTAVSYAVCIFLVWWMLDGKANRHTANDNTSGVLTLLETALALPPKDREKVCFAFFDNEEKGLFGSAAFTKRHKAAKINTMAINFDCVSDGDDIHFFPSKALKSDAAALERIEAAFQSRSGKRVEVVRGFGFYPSDNKAFKKGVGVCALKHKRMIGYYIDRIHTSRDTVLQEENILLLRNGALQLAKSFKN